MLILFQYLISIYMKVHFLLKIKNKIICTSQVNFLLNFQFLLMNIILMEC